MDKNNQFIKNSTYRLISKVKWYYDFSKDGEYGFLELNPSMDIYFRGEVVKGILPKNLKEDDWLQSVFPFVYLNNISIYHLKSY